MRNVTRSSRNSLGRRVAATIFALGLVVSACGGADEAAEEPAAEPTAPQDEAEAPAEDDRYGGTLVVAAPAEPDALDPARNRTEADRNITINVYNSLVEFNLDDYSLEPGLAKSWTYSDDGLTITLELEEGVLFHDGSEMTSADVVWTIKDNQNPDNPRTGAALSLVEDVVAVDDYTVELKLSAPDALIPETLVDVYVRPENWVQDPDNLIGTGPFRFIRWERNVGVFLERNDDYWREGLPYLDAIEFRTAADDQARILRLETGEAQILPRPPFPSIEGLRAGGFEVVTAAQGAGAIYDIRFNVRNAPWDDVRVRQAFNYALDREAIEGALLGLYGNIDNPVLPTSPFFNPDAPSYEHDPERARELLAEAGYPDGLDAGEFMQHYELGFDFEVLSQLIQAQAAEVGIRLELANYDVATWVSKYLSPDGWGVGLSNGLARPTPYDLVNHTWGKGRPGAQGHDETMPEFLELLATTRGYDPSSQEFMDGLKEAQVIAMTELPSIVVGTKPLPDALAPSVQGFKGHPSGFTVLHEVWLG